jgi:hypothetical protein
MKVIHSNQSGTVGIVSDVGKLQHAGTFSVKLLKEWMRQLEDVYGEDDEELHIFIRKSDAVDAYGIFASSDGGNPLVAVMGKYPDDGQPWGKQGAEKTG